MVSLSSPSSKLNPFYLARSVVLDTWAELLVLMSLTNPLNVAERSHGKVKRGH